MPTVNIDNVVYDLDSLSDKANENFQMLKITDQEIARLQAQMPIHKAARVTFANALRESLPSQMGETISFAGLR